MDGSRILVALALGLIISIDGAATDTFAAEGDSNIVKVVCIMRYSVPTTARFTFDKTKSLVTAETIANDVLIQNVPLVSTDTILKWTAKGSTGTSYNFSLDRTTLQLTLIKTDPAAPHVPFQFAGQCQLDSRQL